MQTYRISLDKTDTVYADDVTVLIDGEFDPFDSEIPDSDDSYHGSDYAYER